MSSYRRKIAIKDRDVLRKKYSEKAVLANRFLLLTVLSFEFTFSISQSSPLRSAADRNSRSCGTPKREPPLIRRPCAGRSGRLATEKDDCDVFNQCENLVRISRFSTVIIK
jgi:hypothetical protein